MTNRMWNHEGDSIGRRDFLALGLGLAAAAAAPSAVFGAQAGTGAMDRRKLGSLDVSAAYDRYYEVRAYQRAPFAARPTDVLTFIASRRRHSRYVTDLLAAQGKTYWTRSRSLTGTYTLHLSRGNYLSLSAGYQRGAAITPRVDDSLTTTAYWILYL